MLSQKKNQKTPLKMAQITKQAFISMVEDLNGIIRDINYDNCYDKVIEFFNLAGNLEDHFHDIYELQLKGRRILGIKSRSRMQAEHDRFQFHLNISLARGREVGNLSKSGELASKDNVRFDIGGNRPYTLTELESMETTLTQGRFYPEIVPAQPISRQKIVDFVKMWRKSFTTDWLR